MVEMGLNGASWRCLEPQACSYRHRRCLSSCASPTLLLTETPTARLGSGDSLCSKRHSVLSSNISSGCCVTCGI